MAKTIRAAAANENEAGPDELGGERICDYISGVSIRATPEELEAVQIFSRRLVEDYGYPRAHIQTRPQWRVRIRPSDKVKSYPVDIAVFGSETKTEENLFIVVECRQKTRKDGVEQLKLYLDMSAAMVGVWFNGDEHEYLRKVHHPDGSRTYEPLPNIPRHGQRIEDIGLYTTKDLRKPSNLKAIFRDLRNHLAGMTTGITRDEALAQEIINILFCKILDEQETARDETVTFRAGVGENAGAVRDRVLQIFERVKTATFDDVFTPNDAITLDAESIRYVVGELQNYAVMDADRDAIGDAFEVFISPALRGSEGQFFTPRNVVKLVVEILDPQPNERIIDPACGSGGFLISSLEHVWQKLKTQQVAKGWTDKQLFKREVEVSTEYFRGIEKDAFLAKVCKAYMALVGDGRGGVFCANSLNRSEDWPDALREKVKIGTFHVVMTNPPFGSKIVVKGERILSQYDLGHKWKRPTGGTPVKTNTIQDDQPPQLLFLERCLQLLKNGGRMGIIMPESVLGNPSYAHVVLWLLERCRIIAVITMPESLFKTSGKGGTHTKVCVLLIEKISPEVDYSVFMAEAKWCGHDSRGNPTLRKNQSGVVELLDDVPSIIARYKSIRNGEPCARDHLGFLLPSSELKKRVLVPKYYSPEIDAELSRLAKTHKLVTVGDLLTSGVLSLDTGIEIGKMAYGTGKIPFIRTSDISNWEIKADFKHGVSTEIYESLRHKIDVQSGDILMVRDGTYLIGITAIVTESDVPMLFQSHIYRIRVLDKDRLNPWLLFASLNAPIVKRQIRAKQFTQDIIDTLGRRLLEVVLPIPKAVKIRERIARDTRHVIETRVELRNRAKQIALEVEGLKSMEGEIGEVLEDL
jgi:type I restriction enzyme M protein